MNNTIFIEFLAIENIRHKLVNLAIENVKIKKNLLVPFDWVMKELLYPWTVVVQKRLEVEMITVHIKSELVNLAAESHAIHPLPFMLHFTEACITYTGAIIEMVICEASAALVAPFPGRTEAAQLAGAKDTTVCAALYNNNNK